MSVPPLFPLFMSILEGFWLRMATKSTSHCDLSTMKDTLQFIRYPFSFCARHVITWR